MRFATEIWLFTISWDSQASRLELRRLLPPPTSLQLARSHFRLLNDMATITNDSVFLLNLPPEVSPPGSDQLAR